MDYLQSHSHFPRPSSRQSSISSNTTIIEPNQPPDVGEPSAVAGGPELADEDPDGTAAHERRLRLIDANRTLTRLEEADDGCAKPLAEVDVLFTAINQRKTFAFEPATSVQTIKHTLFTQWPSDWIQDENPCPKELDQLRIVYMGRFLKDEEKLSNLRLNPSSPTIVHLVVKPDECTDPDPKPDDSSHWCCILRPGSDQSLDDRLRCIIT